MAKVVIIWNEHPHEVVAGFHARKVARILKEKYGHEITLHKMPYNKSNTSILQQGTLTNLRQTAIKLKEMQGTKDKTREIALKHDSWAFNFHCSPTYAFDDAENTVPEDFQTKKSLYSDEKGERFKDIPNPAKGQIYIRGDERQPKTNFFVEIPAVYIKNKRKLLIKVHTKLKRIIAGFMEPEARWNLKKDYHERLTPISAPEQQKYLSPAISEKIAKEINQIISGQV